MRVEELEELVELDGAAGGGAGGAGGMMVPPVVERVMRLEAVPVEELEELVALVENSIEQRSGTSLRSNSLLTPMTSGGGAPAAGGAGFGIGSALHFAEKTNDAFGVAPSRESAASAHPSGGFWNLGSAD